MTYGHIDVRPLRNHRLFSARTLAEELDLTERHIRRLMATGELPVIRIGNPVRVPREALEEFIQKHSAASA